MARLRTLKPAFFLNEELAALPPLARLLFAGLWCLADREGRLEDRPARIKAETLPYDRVNVDELLSKLHSSGFVVRYSVGDANFIQVVNFLKHQTPHAREAESVIPRHERHDLGRAEPDARPVLGRVESGAEPVLGDAEPDAEPALCGNTSLGSGNTSLGTGVCVDLGRPEPDPGDAACTPTPGGFEFADLLTEYAGRFPGGADEVRRRIENCQNDVSYDRVKDKRKRLRSWLDRDIEWIKAHGSGGNGAGRAARPRRGLAGNGQRRNDPAAGEGPIDESTAQQEVDPRVRDPRELKKLGIG